MKISVNDQELFTMSEMMKQVIGNDIPIEVLEEDLQRRIAYIIAHKYERCFERLKKEWEPKLVASGIASIPTDKDAFAALVFSQPDYKNRSARELDVAGNKEAFDKAIVHLQSNVRAQLDTEKSKF